MAPTTSLNTTQAGAQITRGGYHWGTGAVGAAAGPISFGFRQSAPSYNDPDSNPQGTFQPVTAAQMGAARALDPVGQVVGLAAAEQGAELHQVPQFGAQPGDGALPVLVGQDHHRRVDRGHVATVPGQ